MLPDRGEVTRLGKLAGGSAWSTMKVPIAIRVLDGGATPAQRSEIQRALTASDNSAAESLFASLGSPTAAAAAVTEVLRSAGDQTTQVSSVGRDSFSPYGQTDWTLEAQHRFMAALAGGCVGEPSSRRHPGTRPPGRAARPPQPAAQFSPSLQRIHHPFTAG